MSGDSNMCEMLEEKLRDVDGLEYSTATGKFTITMLEDLNQMMELYRTNPVVRTFTNREIKAKKQYLYDIDNPRVYGYELWGFFYCHQGEVYTIDPQEYFN